MGPCPALIFCPKSIGREEFNPSQRAVQRGATAKEGSGMIAAEQQLSECGALINTLSLYYGMM